MKKLIVITLILVMLVGCSSTKNNSKQTNNIEEDNKSTSLKVDENLLDVEITLPASFIGEEANLDNVISEAKKNGVKEVIQNEDGTLTYKMSKKTHEKMLEDYKETLVASINVIKNNEEIKSIKDITYDDDFTEITLVVDQKAYENSLDSMAAVGVIVSAMYYQIFDGVNADDTKVTLNVKDAETNEIIDTTIYPDSLVEE